MIYADSLKRLEIGSILEASLSSLRLRQRTFDRAARAKNYGRRRKMTELPDDSLDEMFRTLEPLTSLCTVRSRRCILGEDEIADDASPALHHDPPFHACRSRHDKVHTQLNSMLNCQSAPICRMP